MIKIILFTMSLKRGDVFKLFLFLLRLIESLKFNIKQDIFGKN